MPALRKASLNRLFKFFNNHGEITNVPILAIEQNVQISIDLLQKHEEQNFNIRKTFYLKSIRRRVSIRFCTHFFCLIAQVRNGGNFKACDRNPCYATDSHVLCMLDQHGFVKNASTTR